MVFAGYGFSELGPDGEVNPASEWDGWRRMKGSRMDRVVDETWASWELPSHVCFGDSGGATFFNAHPVTRPFDVSLVAVASDGGIDCLKPDYRARVIPPPFSAGSRKPFSSTCGGGAEDFTPRSARAAPPEGGDSLV